jgi:TonB family protein
VRKLAALFLLIAPPFTAQAATPPQLRTASVTEKDYPAEAIAQSSEGDADVTFSVGVDGKVSDCAATDPQANAILVAGSCRVVGKWRFRPARDDAGQKVAAQLTQPFSWRLYNPCKQPAEDNRICVNLELKRQ